MSHKRTFRVFEIFSIFGGAITFVEKDNATWQGINTSWQGDTDVVWRLAA